MWIQSLGQENPLEEEMATHSSILAWRISWIEEPGGLQCMGSQRVDMTEQLTWRSGWEGGKIFAFLTSSPETLMHTLQINSQRDMLKHTVCSLPKTLW